MPNLPTSGHFSLLVGLPLVSCHTSDIVKCFLSTVPRIQQLITHCILSHSKMWVSHGVKVLFVILLRRSHRVTVLNLGCTLMFWIDVFAKLRAEVLCK